MSRRTSNTKCPICNAKISKRSLMDVPLMAALASLHQQMADVWQAMRETGDTNSGAVKHASAFAVAKEMNENPLYNLSQLYDAAKTGADCEPRASLCVINDTHTYFAAMKQLQKLQQKIT